MRAGIIVVDCFALLAMIVGGLMVFRQPLVRRWWALLNGRPPRADDPSAEQDPVHYALIIFGMMLFAFGLMIFGFFTSFALLT